MKSLTYGHVKLARAALRSNRWRSFLTMLGVIIGVASVIIVVGIGQGVKNQVNGQINKLGKDLITVRASTVGAESGLSALSSLNVLSSLPEKDYGAVTTTHGVDTAVPLSLLDGQIRGDEVDNGSLVIGTSSDLARILNQPVTFGVFWGADESQANVAVLGQAAAQRIFNEDVPLGRSFSFRGQQFVVRGVFDNFDFTPLAGDADFNNAVFIPYSVAQNISGHSAPLYEVLAKPTDSKQVDTTVAAIRSNLLKNHGGQSDFSVLTSNRSLAGTNTILDLLTNLISGVAAISLLVGGVGIMNVMLVSVTERMHEIGIRKAVGATNRQILNQFLIEATLLSLAGGIIGTLLALLLTLGLRLLTSLQPAVSWQVIGLAVGVSLLVGIVFGSAPALKAARKQPIDALRNE